MALYESFNQSGFSKFLNSPTGRVIRFASGVGFLLGGCLNRKKASGVISILWGLLPLSAGVFDVCYISGALGGPLSGKEIRATQVKS
ncbi:MAG: hypothetical protein ACM3UT_01520 [Chloroflexota bacterium]